MRDSPIRVLISKVGLDGHDRGVRIVARGLRDAGMEVIYAGLHRTPEELVEAALEEDVEVMGLSIHSAAHMTLFPRVLDLLRSKGLDHVLVTGGGIISREDAEALGRIGMGRLFAPGTPIEEIVGYIEAEVARRREAAAADSHGR